MSLSLCLRLYSSFSFTDSPFLSPASFTFSLTHKHKQKHIRSLSLNDYLSLSMSPTEWLSLCLCPCIYLFVSLSPTLTHSLRISLELSIEFSRTLELFFLCLSLLPTICFTLHRSSEMKNFCLKLKGIRSWLKGTSRNSPTGKGCLHV